MYAAGLRQIHTMQYVGDVWLMWDNVSEAADKLFLSVCLSVCYHGYVRLVAFEAFSSTSRRPALSFSESKSEKVAWISWSINWS